MHERDDEDSVYPELAAVLRERHGLSAMSRAHREILHLARLLARIAEDLPRERIDRYLIRAAQRVIEAIETLVRMHTVQEEDIYAPWPNRRQLGVARQSCSRHLDVVRSGAPRVGRRSYGNDYRDATKMLIRREIIGMDRSDDISSSHRLSGFAHLCWQGRITHPDLDTKRPPPEK